MATTVHLLTLCSPGRVVVAPPPVEPRAHPGGHFDVTSVGFVDGDGDLTCLSHLSLIIIKLCKESVAQIRSYE